MPTNSKINIIFIALAILLVIFAFLISSNKREEENNKIKISENNNEYMPKYEQTPIDSNYNLRTYHNARYGYSVKYPLDWAFREFPDIETGAAFRPMSTVPEIASEAIVINEMGRAVADCDVPFEEYVRTAGPREIQNYNKLDSFEPIITKSGIHGYRATWVVTDFSGPTTHISTPISYFQDKNVPCDADRGGSTIEVSLSNNAYLDTYDQIVESFDFVIK